MSIGVLSRAHGVDVIAKCRPGCKEQEYTVSCCMWKCVMSLVNVY